MESRLVVLQQVASIPVAVVRRRASAAQLSTLVPEYCGLVWRAVQAQKETGAKGGRHVAIYWNGDIRPEVGVELQVPFAETDEVVRSAIYGHWQPEWDANPSLIRTDVLYQIASP